MEEFFVGPGILSYKNVIKGSENLVDRVESLVNAGTISWVPSTISGDYSGLNTEIRDTLAIDIPYLKYPKIDYSSPQKEFESSISSLFLTSFKPAEDHYRLQFDVSADVHENYSILKYGVGQKFTNHVDDSPELTRRISMVYYINDNYEGGEIVFPRFNVSYKPTANELILFPSFYMYNHSVLPVTKGTRYSVVSWIS